MSRRAGDARPVFVAARTRLAAAPALALATAVAQALSGALWFAVIALTLRLRPGAAIFEHGIGGRVTMFGGLALGLWAVAILGEAGVAYGVGRFIARVRPDLLPDPRADAAAAKASA